MCGINGSFAYHNAAPVIDRAQLVRVRDHMAARGPDGQGAWFSANGRAGFGHRRLSIIDLSDAGAQPMVSGDGQLIVTFNGEIYNYRELRTGLEGRGHVFKTQSDTEVLLHLYAEKGEAMVKELRGMFAFAIFEVARNRLLLARDPFGIKPLYYADNGQTIHFASSVKALMAGGAISAAPDPAGVVGFYVFGSVPEPFTIYRAIRSVPAGSVLVIDGAGADLRQRYFSIPAALRTAEDAPVMGAQQLQDRFSAALLDSVRHHLIADVPVGAFLSAGIDSSALVGLMRTAGQSSINTVTLAFGEFEGTLNDESSAAARVAEYYGTRHSTRWVNAQEFEQDLPRILDAMDQPSIDGINTWFVSKAAHELGLKVAVSGVGGDELLGGYSTFDSLPRRVRQVRRFAWIPGAGRGADIAVGATRKLGLRVHPKAAGLLKYGGTLAGAYLLQRGLFLPAELGTVIEDPAFVREGLVRLDPLGQLAHALREGPVQSFGQVAALESSFYLRNQLLRDTDWAGMAHSLEIRTPLVDSQLLCDVAPLMAQTYRPTGKMLMAYAPDRALPSDVVNREKTGFGIPVQRWMREISPAGAQADEFGALGQGRLWSRAWARHVMAAHEAMQMRNVTG